MPPVTPASSVVDAVCANYDHDRQNLIPLLQDVQDRLGYLSEEVIHRISEFVGVSDTESCAVATFYTQFRFHPPGKHCIRVCQGTACHVRGSSLIRELVSRKLGIVPGETTSDLRFSLERVACLGSCALAPAVVIDDKVYARMTPKKVEKRIDEISR